MILQGLKPCILTQKGKDVHAQLSTRARKWVAEVPSVLWTLQTTPNRSTNFAPFFMVYGAEVVLSTKLQYGSLGSGPINQTCPKKPGRMPSTYSNNPWTLPSQGLLDTNRHSDGATYACFIPGLSR
jgi:hypothetical protein